jgi:hypothetical protein
MWHGFEYLICAFLRPIGKFPYLFFPRDIHDTFGVVEQAFLQQVHKPQLEPCALDEDWCNSQDPRL